MSTQNPKLYACSFTAAQHTPDRKVLLKTGMCFVPAKDEDEARQAAEAKSKVRLPAAEGYSDHFAVAVMVPAYAGVV